MSLLQAFIMAKLMGGSGGGTTGITDVQINGTSVVSGGVANVPLASTAQFGAVREGTDQLGVGVFTPEQSPNNPGSLYIKKATEYQIKNPTSNYAPIVPSIQNLSVFYGLAQAAGDLTQSASANAVGQYTPAAKSAISTMLNASEPVTGTTPTITALAGVQYVCGEVSTLDITPPASGCFDVIFESGSTPTVLTISNPTGTTVEWLDDFDPTNLSANAVYEINLLRIGTRYLGVAASWT